MPNLISFIQLTPYPLPSHPVEWHKNDILSLQASPDGQLLASAGEFDIFFVKRVFSLIIKGLDGQVIISEVASRSLMFRFQLSETTHPTCLAWASPFQGSKRLAVGYQDGTICILPLDTSIPPNQFILLENSPPLLEIRFDPGKNRLLIAYETLCSVISLKADDGDISDGFGVFEFRSEVGGIALLGSEYLLVSVPTEKKL
jgi:WD40 repeat protein